MNIKIISFLLSLVVILTTGCGEKIESSWKRQTLTIDGDGQDWEGLPLLYKEDMKIVYGIVNDGETIDFMIRFNDQNLARLFSMRGFTLWLNDRDSDEKLIGIHYRDDAMRDNFMAEGRKRSRAQEPQEYSLLQSGKLMGKFTLAKNDSITAALISDFKSFGAVAASKDGIFCYEFSIPLTSVDGSPYYLNLADQEIINVGLEILGMSEEEQDKIKAEMEERQGSMQDGNKGGRSGRGKGGGTRGGGKRGGANRPQMPDMDGEEYWISVQLAKK